MYNLPSSFSDLAQCAETAPNRSEKRSADNGKIDDPLQLPRQGGARPLQMC